jgi:hypothetical protein
MAIAESQKRIVITLGAIVLVAIAVFFVGSWSVKKQDPQASSSTSSSTIPSTQTTTASTSTSPSAAVLKPPLSNALARITKKTFGMYVTPKNSPVSPEKFSGYHTGVDFETTPDEQNVDVPISAVCTGPLVLKKWATGYGGVAVQLCKLQNQDVTIIYGHLNISTVAPVVGQTLQAGDRLGMLGKGYSTETDGERKHLHLGIHKGTAINILGYVQKQSDLNNWIDAEKLLE